jgi:hypothetical protein
MKVSRYRFSERIRQRREIQKAGLSESLMYMDLIRRLQQQQQPQQPQQSQSLFTCNSNDNDEQVMLEALERVTKQLFDSLSTDSFYIVAVSHRNALVRFLTGMKKANES